MATYKDQQGREITQTAYDAQKKANADVSGFQEVATPIAPVVTDTLAKVKELPQYQELLAKGYTEDQITKAVSAYKPVKPVETQVIPQPENTTATPEVKTEQVPTKVVETPKTEVQAEVVKTPEQIQAEADRIRYNDNSEERLAAIANNLNNAVATNPNSLKTLDAFKSAYSYNLRSKEQQQVLNDWYAGYQKSQKLGLTPVSDIVDGYSNGTISSTDLESLKASNPTKYAEVQMGIDTKKQFQSFKDMLYGKEETTTNLANTTVDVVDTNLFDEYKAAINTPEVKELQTNIADQDGKISQLKLELIKIQDDVENQYKGTGASSSKIAAIVADRQQDIQNQISKLSIDQNTSINKYNSIVNTAKDIMTLGLQEKTAEQQERAAKMQELGFFYQYTPSGMAQMATAKYNAENPDLDSPNVGTSTMALNQTLDAYYKDYGDIIQRPKAQVVNDVMKLAKSKGISVSQALKENFVEPLQNKKEYKAKIRKDYGMDKSIVTINGVDYQYDPATGKYSTPNVPVTPTNPIDLTNPSGLGDLSTSTLVSQYPNEASFKNNNPTGIKMSASDALKKMRTDAGISYGEGTTSPEGGKYVKFATMEDGLKAYKIALSTRGDDVYARLKQWKGVGDTEGYANQIMSEAGIEKGAKFSSLSPEKMNALMNAQLKRESGALYKYMNGAMGTTGNAPTPVQEQRYKDGKIDPKGINGLTQTQYNQIANYYKTKEGDVSGVMQYAIKGIQLANFSTEKARESALADIQKLAATGDINAVQTKLKNIYKQQLGATEMQAYTTNENTIGALAMIKEELKSIPTNYLKGGIEKLAQKLGTSTDPKLAKLGIKMNNALDILRRGRSGAALTEFEEAFYNAMFPTINKNFEFNNAAIDGLTESLQNNIDTRLISFYGTDVYDNLFSSSNIANTPQIDLNSIYSGMGAGNIATVPTGYPVN